MGYISNHNTIDEQKLFDKSIVQEVYKNVRHYCIELIEIGYNNYLLDAEKSISIDETLITAGLYNHISIFLDEKDLPFSIVPEYVQYTNAIKKGKIHPRKAKKFDLFFTHFQSTPRVKFGVEAKLVAEHNTPTRSATTLNTDYVEDAGMGKFINKLYETEGFMLGYIINGNKENIVDVINKKINNTYSNKEQLIKDNQHYISTYFIEADKKELVHIFLDFSICFSDN